MGPSAEQSVQEKQSLADRSSTVSSVTDWEAFPIPRCRGLRFKVKRALTLCWERACGLLVCCGVFF